MNAQKALEKSQQAATSAGAAPGSGNSLADVPAQVAAPGASAGGQAQDQATVGVLEVQNAFQTLCSAVKSTMDPEERGVLEREVTDICKEMSKLLYNDQAPPAKRPQGVREAQACMKECITREYIGEVGINGIRGSVVLQGLKAANVKRDLIAFGRLVVHQKLIGAQIKVDGFFGSRRAPGDVTDDECLRLGAHVMEQARDSVVARSTALIPTTGRAEARRRSTGLEFRVQVDGTISQDEAFCDCVGEWIPSMPADLQEVSTSFRRFMLVRYADTLFQSTDSVLELLRQALPKEDKRLADTDTAHGLCDGLCTSLQPLMEQYEHLVVEVGVPAKKNMYKTVNKDKVLVTAKGSMFDLVLDLSQRRNALSMLHLPHMLLYKQAIALQTAAVSTYHNSQKSSLEFMAGAMQAKAITKAVKFFMGKAGRTGDLKAHRQADEVKYITDKLRGMGHKEGLNTKIPGGIAQGVTLWDALQAFSSMFIANKMAQAERDEIEALMKELDIDTGDLLTVGELMKNPLLLPAVQKAVQEHGGELAGIEDKDDAIYVIAWRAILHKVAQSDKECTPLLLCTVLESALVRAKLFEEREPVRTIIDSLRIRQRIDDALADKETAGAGHDAAAQGRPAPSPRGAAGGSSKGSGSARPAAKKTIRKVTLQDIRDRASAGKAPAGRASAGRAPAGKAPKRKSTEEVEDSQGSAGDADCFDDNFEAAAMAKRPRQDSADRPQAKEPKAKEPRPANVIVIDDEADGEVDGEVDEVLKELRLKAQQAEKELQDAKDAIKNAIKNAPDPDLVHVKLENETNEEQAARKAKEDAARRAEDAESAKEAQANLRRKEQAVVAAKSAHHHRMATRSRPSK